MEIVWKALVFVQSDAAQMLCIDGCGDVVGHNRAAATGAHYRDQDIAGKHAVAFELPVLFKRDESALAPTKFVCDGIVYSQNSDTSVDELAV